MIKVNLSKKKNNNPIDTVVLDLNNFIYLPKPPPPPLQLQIMCLFQPQQLRFSDHIGFKKWISIKKNTKKTPKPGIDLSNRISNKSYR